MRCPWVFLRSHAGNIILPLWLFHCRPVSRDDSQGTVQQIANGDLLRPLRIECWDYDRAGGHDFIGSCSASIGDMLVRPFVVLMEVTRLVDDEGSYFSRALVPRFLVLFLRPCGAGVFLRLLARSRRQLADRLEEGSCVFWWSACLLTWHFSLRQVCKSRLLDRHFVILVATVAVLSLLFFFVIVIELSVPSPSRRWKVGASSAPLPMYVVRPLDKANMRSFSFFCPFFSPSFAL